jgi:hypothetical protein
MLKPLSISGPELDSLAAGGGSRAAVQTLLAGQFSRRVLQVLAVLDSARDAAPYAVRDLHAAYALLCEVQAASPEAVRSVLTLPCAGFWADACLRGDTGAIGYRYLMNLAVLAAKRAGCELPPGSLPAPAWYPAGLLRAGPPGRQLNVWLADRGPFRGPPGIALAPPLTARQAARWRRMLARAWQIVISRHPEQVPAMTLALRTLTPMAGRPRNPGAGYAGADGGQDSVTAMSAPGAVLLTPPRHAEAMALTLLHEVQHTKLAALEHMLALHSADAQARYFAPWREDPRPLGALLHGAYAHLGVAAYWHGAITSVDGTGYGNAAEAELIYWVWAVRTAIAQLQDSGALTGVGQRFVAGMETAASRLAALPVSGATRLRAAWRIRQEETAWRTRRRRETRWDSVNCPAGVRRRP